MKIVHVSIGAWPPVFTSHGGAIQRRVAELAQAQVRRGHEVAVFSPGPERRTAEVGGVEVHYVPTRIAEPWSRIEYQVRAMRAIRRTHRGADALHVHSEPEGALLGRGLNALKFLSYDYFEFRGGRESRLRPLYRRALMDYDMLLPCSEYCRTASCAYWDIPRSRAKVLFNGVNIEQFKQDAAAAEQERYRLEVDGKVLFYLGRVCTQKGTDLMIDAYSDVLRRHPQTSLVIAGPIGQFTSAATSAEEASWKARMSDAGVIYLGAVHESRLVGLLNLADVFVMPTRELEMFGMAAAEALACGTPVVASDHGGLKEVVSDGTGLRFPPGDAASLSAALSAILADDGLRATLGHGAHEHAQRFAWDRIAEDFECIFEDAGS